MQKHRNESGTKDSNEGSSHTEKIDLQPTRDEDVNEKQMSLPSENHKIASDSDSSYDMLQQNNDINTMEEDEKQDRTGLNL